MGVYGTLKARKEIFLSCYAMVKIAAATEASWWLSCMSTYNNSEVWETRRRSFVISWQLFVQFAIILSKKSKYLSASPLLSFSLTEPLGVEALCRAGTRLSSTSNLPWLFMGRRWDIESEFFACLWSRLLLPGPTVLWPVKRAVAWVLAVTDLWNLSRDVHRWVLSCDLLTSGYEKGSYWSNPNYNFLSHCNLFPCYKIYAKQFSICMVSVYFNLPI